MVDENILPHLNRVECPVVRLLHAHHLRHVKRLSLVRRHLLLHACHIIANLTDSIHHLGPAEQLRSWERKLLVRTQSDLLLMIHGGLRLEFNSV